MYLLNPLGICKDHWHFKQSTFPTVNARGKNTYQITGIRTNTRSTHSILYKVASLKWSKNVHGALANLIKESQNVCL